MQNVRNYKKTNYISTKKHAITFLASALIILTLASVIFAGKASPVKPKDNSDVSTVSSSNNPNLFDVNASGIDIKLVLEALARRSKTNIVVSPEISGDLTIHLKQMPLESILNYLSIVQGFAWKKDGDAYLVGPREKLEPPAKEAVKSVINETAIVEFKYLRPQDVVPLIEKMFPSLKVHEGPCMVTPGLEAGASKSGSSSTSSRSSSSLGSSSGSASISTASTGSIGRSYNNKIIIIGPAEDVASARDMLSKLDIPRPQVKIEVAIVQLNGSDSKQLGVDWTWTNAIIKETDSSNMKFGKFSKKGMTFTGAVSLMIENNMADLLAKPNISVVDGEYAEILIGDRILFPKLIGYDNNNLPIYDKEEERVGIYLQIAPKVTGDNDVILTLYPQVSLVTGYLKTQVGDYPQISTREAMTTVSVEDGDTIAIGGLLQQDEIRNAKKIPLLGDLPVIGKLFRHDKVTKERNEIVIFLTPKIVKPGEKTSSGD